MKRGTKVAVCVIGIIAVLLIAGYVAVHSVSGLDSPFSVVMSASMQHDDNKSGIGVIDTGDVVLIQDPAKSNIQSYVEGTVSGYKSFGDYGNVIIYDRGDSNNPVIHRAIVWLNYNAIDSTWSAPSLASYTGYWTCSDSKDYMKLSGVLTFFDLTQSKKRVSIDLNSIDEKQSGFLTLGDNPKSNTSFDQSGLIKHPIGNDDIKSVAIMEIPWMGILKVFMSEKSGYLSHVPNSIYSLVMLFSMVFIFIYCCDFIHLKKRLDDNRRKFEELCD